MGCLYHPHYLVMINGNSKGFFNSSRDQRQGNPLSPFLFTLVVDAFNALMVRAEEVRGISGFNQVRKICLYHIFNLRTIPYVL